MSTQSPSLSPPRRRVGLVRHLQVAHPMPSGWLTAMDLQNWQRAYETAPLADPASPKLAELVWSRCYSSDAPRCVETATRLYGKDFEITARLREPNIGLITRRGVRLPYALWRWVLRLLWLTGAGGQRGVRDEFLARAREVADLVDDHPGDVLLFTHAGMMMYLRKELIRRGYEAPRYTIARHGHLYVFNRELRESRAAR